MFAGLILILSFFNYESPRFLIKKGKDELATINLARIRHLPVDDPHVIKEIGEIQAQLQEELEATMGQGWTGLLKEMFLMPNNFYRIYLGLFSQLLSQWSGAQSITGMFTLVPIYPGTNLTVTVYAPDFFEKLGTKGQNEKLFATCIFGVVKFVAAIICAFFLVDVIGRKRSLGIGIGLQAVSMTYIAAFLTAVPQIAAGEEISTSQKHAATAAIVMIYISGFGWAMGWNSMQYLLNAEIYPLRIRAMSSSMVMCFHFANQYASNRAVPSMLLEKNEGGKMGGAGAFWFFAGLTIVGGVWAWFFIPETAGRSLEGMDRLFTLKWWQIGRMGETEANATQTVHDEKVKDMEGRAAATGAEISQVEKV
jgi:hypothetical protein